MAKHVDTSRPVDAMPWRDRDTAPTQPVPVVRPVAPRFVDAWSGHADTDRYWR